MLIWLVGMTTIILLAGVVWAVVMSLIIDFCNKYFK